MQMRRWQSVAVGAVLSCTAVAAYWTTLGGMWQRWYPAWGRADLGLIDRISEGESYYTHGPLMAVVSVAAALLLLRYTRIAVAPRRRAGAVVLCAGLLVLHLGMLGRVSFISALSLPIVISGLILLLWGAEALKRLWFPVAILGFMIPLPEVTIAELNFRLKLVATDWGVRLAGLAGVTAVRSGNQAFLAGGQSLVVANVCNGLRTLLSLVAFGALFAYVSRLRGAWAALLFAMSIPVALASNALRIAALVVAASVLGVEAATGWFHDASGIGLLAVAMGLMFALERVLLEVRAKLSKAPLPQGRFSAVMAADSAGGQWSRLGHALCGRRALVAAGLLGLSAALTLWSARPLRNVLPAADSSLLASRVTIDGLRYDSYSLDLDERTLTILEHPSYCYRRYVPAKTTRPAMDVWLLLAGENRKGIHPPDLCLEGGSAGIIAKRDVTAPCGGGEGIPCRELIVQDQERTYYYLYTYRFGRQYTRSYWHQQMRLLAGGLLGRPTQGALIRVSSIFEAAQLEQTRREAFAMLEQALPRLDAALP
ncbi:MAG: exosortase C-terminal domain/associated protein EpsI [Planctomycetaceae bacterium]|nr:EpsI family protein [Planctomycetaceae bacterium]